jgi:hypothetical protein
VHGAEVGWVAGFGFSVNVRASKAGQPFWFWWVPVHIDIHQASASALFLKDFCLLSVKRSVWSRAIHLYST